MQRAGKRRSTSPLAPAAPLDSATAKHVLMLVRSLGPEC